MLLVSPTESLLHVAQDLSTFLCLFSALGFVIIIPKTTVTASVEIEFLEFTLNTETMTVALPTVKMDTIQSKVYKIPQTRTVCVKGLSQILGKLIAIKPAVFRAPLRYQALQHLKIILMKSGQQKSALPPEAQKDLT